MLTRELDLPQIGRKPRLTIWTNCEAFGGVGEFTHSMAIGMRLRGYEVTVVGPKFDETKRKYEQGIGIEHCQVQLPETGIHAVTIGYEPSTTAVIRELAPDVVLFADGGPIASLLAKKCVSDLSIPMVFSLGIVLEVGATYAVRWPGFQKIYEAAHSVVTVSRHNAQLLSRLYPIGSVEPKLIHYGRPETFFRPVNDNRRQEYRAKLGASPDDLVFLTAARYDWIKGYDFFLATLERLRKEPIWSRLRFAWAGEGPLEAQLRAALGELGVGDRVHLLGPRSDIDCWLDAADAFVLPSRAEGMPLSVAEAMAKGIPIIATTVGGIPEQVSGYALLIQPKDFGQVLDVAFGIYQAIYWIANNPEKRNELGRLGKARAEELFREDRMIADYARLIGAAGTNIPDKAKPHDYVSPGLAVVKPDKSFPNMRDGNTGECDWPYLRREIMHNWYVDRRHPGVGFLSRDEAALLYNAALSFTGQAALEIGSFMGWSTCHLALGGVYLDVVDPFIVNQYFRASIEGSLRAAGAHDRVNLVAGKSPEAVQALARDGKRWSLVFIDGDHEGDAPRKDAETVEPFATDDCVVLFHDVAAPAVANGLRYFKQCGWKIRIYRTMQVMAAAWRGQIEPPVHFPDTSISIPLPLHLADLVDTSEFPKLHAQCAAYTMTSIERQFALFQAVRYVVEKHVPGDIVECGVWRGGSMMLSALTLGALGAMDRRLVLYDTFSGMTLPTEHDVESLTGRTAEHLLAVSPRSTNDHYWAIAPLDDVRRNMEITNYPSEQIEYVVGDVCQTLPASQPRPIALLRLDTDWYQSTRCELEQLFERLQPGGILIVDDYGYWQGSRRACDEFFARRPERLHRIGNDQTGYIAVKGAKQLPEEFARRLVLA
jgi:glycosyltransferase involved in cell wall biosynthesis/predicted O-methyltransferase YrrM